MLVVFINKFLLTFISTTGTSATHNLGSCQDSERLKVKVRVCLL